MKLGAQGNDESTVAASSRSAAIQLATVSGSPRQGQATPVEPPRIPDHELLRCIGRGGYGEVWLARSVLGEYRAVKVVYRKNFEHERPYEREFEGIRKFEPVSRTDDSQVDVLHVGRDEQAGYFYYVMELADDASAERGVRGAESQEKSTITALDPQRYVPHTLKYDLYRQTRLPVDECINIGLALTRALQHLHGNGLVHRDIKPSNIIFMKGAPKLADIGLVASMDASISFVGTLGFLPPEGPGTPQADIYSLGKVLYEMCMGHDRQEYPKLPANLNEFDDPPRLMELNAVILKACDKNPSERYQSAEEMGAELALLERGQSVKRRRTVERRWSIARKAMLATCVLALLLSALPLLKSKGGYTPSPEVAGLYKLGQWHYNQLTPKDHEKAFKYLTEAVRKDPKFVEPYGYLTALNVWDMLPGITNDQQRIREMRDIANKLQTLAPNSGEYHTALSWGKLLERDWRGALEEIVRAGQANPNLPHAQNLHCFYLTMLERFEEAHRVAQRAKELEPSARVTAVIAAWPFIGERRFNEAAAQLKEVLDLDQNFGQGHAYLGDCYEAQSNYVAAIEEYRLNYKASGYDDSKVTAACESVLQAYKTLGEQGYWRKWVELIRADQSLPPDERMFGDRDLAGCYARLGEKEKALDELEKHFGEPNSWFQIKWNPLHDPLRNEDRFKELVKRAHLDN